jgi:hypothetical protein
MRRLDKPFPDRVAEFLFSQPPGQAPAAQPAPDDGRMPLPSTRTDLRTTAEIRDWMREVLKHAGTDELYANGWTFPLDDFPNGGIGAMTVSRYRMPFLDIPELLHHVTFDMEVSMHQPKNRANEPYVKIVLGSLHSTLRGAAAVSRMKRDEKVSGDDFSLHIGNANFNRNMKEAISKSKSDRLKQLIKDPDRLRVLEIRLVDELTILADVIPKLIEAYVKPSYAPDVRVECVTANWNVRDE